MYPLLFSVILAGTCQPGVPGQGLLSLKRDGKRLASAEDERAGGRRRGRGVEKRCSSSLLVNSIAKKEWDATQQLLYNMRAEFHELRCCACVLTLAFMGYSHAFLHTNLASACTRKSRGKL